MVVKTLFFSLISLLLFSCVKEGKLSNYNFKPLLNYTPPVISVIDSTNSGLSFIPQDFYQYEKQKIKEIRLKLQLSYLLIIDSIEKEQFLDSVSIVFTDLLLNNIIPHWYGTP